MNDLIMGDQMDGAAWKTHLRILSFTEEVSLQVLKQMG